MTSENKCSLLFELVGSNVGRCDDPMKNVRQLMVSLWQSAGFFAKKKEFVLCQGV